ncbi:MAG: DNA alkylation repair protein [Myxococcota bacterium]
MADALKHFFDANIVRGIAQDLERAHPTFSRQAFVKACLAGLDERELLARAWHIADVMQRFLPPTFDAATRVLLASLGPPLPRTEGNTMAPFRYLPHVFFVQKHGLDHFELAMQAQYELTQRLTAESSIRPFLERYPQRTLAQLRQWANDPSVHVRRLVSEGTRPRLPWAPRLRAFIDDPTPVLALLELLKDDPERYVQRSVANNLNDIAKDHPDLVVATCQRWASQPSAATQYIVRHALRSLVKQGHRGALTVLGAGARPRVELSAIRANKRVQLGAELRFEFLVTSTSSNAQELLIDYAVHFVKANGQTRPKVFKLKRLHLAARATAKIGSSVSFADLTTRRHYPGKHRVEVLINGVACGYEDFTVA